MSQHCTMLSYFANKAVATISYLDQYLLDFSSNTQPLHFPCVIKNHPVICIKMHFRKFLLVTCIRTYTTHYTTSYWNHYSISYCYMHEFIHFCNLLHNSGNLLQCWITQHFGQNTIFMRLILFLNKLQTFSEPSNSINICNKIKCDFLEVGSKFCRYSLHDYCSPNSQL
jgi:hypothetical protein